MEKSVFRKLARDLENASSSIEQLLELIVYELPHNPFPHESEERIVELRMRSSEEFTKACDAVDDAERAHYSLQEAVDTATEALRALAKVGEGE